MRTESVGFIKLARLISGDWYKMSVDFVNQGSGSIQGKGSLQDFGTTGTTPGTIFTIDTISLSSLDIASDSSVYAAFRGFGRDGLGNLDNFTAAIPEPATWTLAALAGGALTLIRRRKQ